MNKEGFLLYKSFYEPIKKFSDKELGQLFRMIFEYQLTGVTAVNSVSPLIIVAFEFFKNQFRLDDEKYKTFIELQRAKGAKSAKARWGKGNKEVTGVTAVNRGQPDITEVTYKEKDKDKEKDIIYSKKYFKDHSQEILKEAKGKYPDKNCDQVLKEFLEGIEIKNYGYKNHKLAFFKWVRNSNHQVRENLSLQSDPDKYNNLKTEIIHND